MRKGEGQSVRRLYCIGSTCTGSASFSASMVSGMRITGVPLSDAGAVVVGGGGAAATNSCLV